MSFKKILSIVFAIIICISSASVFAFAEDDSDGDIMLPPSEDVEVSIIYAPIKSRIIYNQVGPILEGIILKVTYYDGHSEVFKVKKVDNGYKAGDFTVSVFCFFLEAIGQPSNYGTKAPGFYVTKHENGLLYEGVTDFSVLSIPNLIEFFNCLKTIVGIYL